MNWGKCKLYALQKIDPAIKNLTPNNTTKDYLNAIVGIANRGLQELCTAGKFITKHINITQSEPKNILPNSLYMMEIYEHDIDRSYEANGAKSYYFEVDGNATVEVYVDGFLTDTIQNTGKGFMRYKGFISNPSNKQVKLVFTGLYYYQYRNVALYDANFPTVNDIWDYVSEKRYNMKELATDFYKLVTTDVVFQSGFNQKRYEKTSDYYWEGDSMLVLNGLQKGSWKVHYYAYPQEISEETLDETELTLDPEVAAILPVYIAAELLEDDDTNLAYYVRQEYQEARQSLRPTKNNGKATFIDVNGW